MESIKLTGFSAAPPPECESNDDCPDHRYCNLDTKTCEDPCLTKRCGINALCNATRHQAICQCIFDYSGDPEVACSKFPSPLTICANVNADLNWIKTEHFKFYINATKFNQIQ